MREQAENAADWLRPEPYSEDPSKREIGITERELNSLLAHNTDLSKKLAIDLADDLASAPLLVPIDPDFPMLGGRDVPPSSEAFVMPTLLRTPSASTHPMSCEVVPRCISSAMLRS